MDARAEILNRIRSAGVPAALLPALPPAELGASDTLEQFAAELQTLSAVCHHAAESAAMATILAEILRSRAIKKIIAWDTPLLAALRAAPALTALALEWTLPTPVDPAAVASWRAQSIAADAGITEVDYALADTGTLVVRASGAQPTLASLVPSLHVAIVPRQRLLANIDALFATLGQNPELSRCLTLITGPSRTADIEKKIVLGVHGPEHLEVIVLG